MASIAIVVSIIIACIVLFIVSAIFARKRRGASDGTLDKTFVQTTSLESRQIVAEDRDAARKEAREARKCDGRHRQSER